MIIAEKLEMNDFVASNGWLDRFKSQHNICNMAVAGEAGDALKPLKVGMREQGKSPGDGRQKTFGTWTRQVVFFFFFCFSWIMRPVTLKV